MAVRVDGEEAGGPPLKTDDEVIVALGRLIDALDNNMKLAQQSKRRARKIVRERRRGRSYREIVPSGDQPLIVEMMRENLKGLMAAASELQHAEAKALYVEGMTMEQIGQLFGITHQRVSAMLKRARSAAPIIGADTPARQPSRSSIRFRS